ncbi:MAG: threonine/serine exporter [Ruminococcaceae bacterium]|nr:threonine/serine exporter [Oscillospiraceae bacterium]
MQILTEWILPCVYAFGACVGFCLLFNIHGPGMLICGSGGALGWLVYLLIGLGTGAVFPRYLVAAVVITLYSELMSRVRHCPVTSYLIVALLPLVPGGGIYHAMRHCLSGNNQQFLSTLLETFGIAGALALGALLGSSMVRLILSSIQRIRK